VGEVEDECGFVEVGVLCGIVGGGVGPEGEEVVVVDVCAHITSALSLGSGSGSGSGSGLFVFWHTYFEDDPPIRHAHPIY